MERNPFKSLRHDTPFFVGCILLAAAISSCEKVINVDLNNASPHVVIEGVVTNQPGPYSVVMSMTGDYFEPSLNFPPIEHAFVLVSDDTGDADTLKETTSGTYVSSGLKGIPGRMYSLKVISQGKEYDAASTMPPLVSIDSIATVPLREPDGDRGYHIYVLFKDPPEPGNYYCLRLHTNKLPGDSISGERYLLYEDKLTNGNEANYHVRAGRNNLFPGDTLTVELLSIDQPTYEYYRTLNNILALDRSPTSLSPANPNTNLSNGSLGYFAAYSIDTRRIVLP